MLKYFTRLETQGLSLSESLNIFKKIRVLANRAPNKIGIAINKKNEKRLKKKIIKII